MFDAAKVGAQFAAPFEEPQLLFLGVVPLLGLLAVSRRPLADARGYPDDNTAGHGLGEKEQEDEHGYYN
jgi:hypothetical protein